MSIEYTAAEHINQAIEDAKEAKRRLTGGYGNMMSVDHIAKAIYYMERAVRYIEIEQEGR